jgi:hypothetical protein
MEKLLSYQQNIPHGTTIDLSPVYLMESNITISQCKNVSLETNITITHSMAIHRNMVTKNTGYYIGAIPLFCFLRSSTPYSN